MSSVSWDTPPFNHSLTVADNAFIQTIVDGMINAGCTRSTLPYTTVTDSYATVPAVDWSPTYALPAIKSNALVGSLQYLFSIVFDVPVGDNTVELEPHPIETEYKRIKKSSYNDTPLKIVFEFNMMNVTNATSIDRYKYFVCKTYIITQSNIKLGTFSTGYNIYSNTVTPWVATYNMKGKSYVSITKNSISIAIGSHTLTNTVNNTHDNDFYRYMININIYRNNGNIYIYGQSSSFFSTPTKYSYYNSADRSFLMFAYNKSNNSTTVYNNLNNPFMMWQFAMPAVIGGQTVNTKVYRYTQYNINTDNEFVITKLNDATASNIELLYKEKDNYIIGKYVNLGNTDRSLCPVSETSLLYSWAFLHDESVVYVKNLGGTL